MTDQNREGTLDADGVERRLTVTVELTPRVLAEAFADMSDEAQAQFFIEVADIASTWADSPHGQWYLVGRHLRECSCATEASRDLIAGIAKGITYRTEAMSL